MREVLLGCAGKGLFEPKWSARILEEWALAARKIGPEGEVIARGEVAQVQANFPSAEVPVHAGLEQRLWLPDPYDIHVLASAVAGSCDAILTSNTKDFPKNILAEEGLERIDPDGFLCRLLADDPGGVEDVAQGVLQVARQMSGQDWDMRKLMKKARLPRFGKAMARDVGEVRDIR